MGRHSKRRARSRGGSDAARRVRQQGLDATGEDGRASAEVEAASAAAAAAEAAAAGLAHAAGDNGRESIVVETAGDARAAVAEVAERTRRVARVAAAARTAAAAASRAAAAARAAAAVRAATEAAGTAADAGAQAQGQRQEAWWASSRAAQAALRRWHATTAKIWEGKRCCALCGVGALGGSKQCDLKLQPPSRLPNGDAVQHAPVALQNFVTAQAAIGPDGQWWVCEWCRTSTVAAREHSVAFDCEYVRQLFRCHPSALAMLGFLDVHLDISRRLSGQVGQRITECILDGPLIRWSSDGQGSVTDAVTDVLAVCLAHNPLFQRFLCMLEVDGLGQRGVPVLSANVVDDIVQRGRRRDPQHGSRQRVMKEVLLTFMCSQPEGERMRNSNAVVRAGTLRLRDAGLTTRNLDVLPTGLDPLHLLDPEAITVETALFPYLFPAGVGGYAGMGGLATYIRRRMLGLLSPFTLHPPYVLLMCQVIAASYSDSICSTTLHDDLVDFTMHNFEAPF
jgi:hypothetical protein